MSGACEAVPDGVAIAPDADIDVVREIGNQICRIQVAVLPKNFVIFADHVRIEELAVLGGTLI